MSTARLVQATVVYAAPGGTWQRTVSVPLGATLADAVAASGVLADNPELRSRPLDLGVFGRPWPPDRVLRDGDRVEIYRPLVVDPKEARRVRAEVRRRRKGEVPSVPNSDLSWRQTVPVTTSGVAATQSCDGKVRPII